MTSMVTTQLYEHSLHGLGSARKNMLRRAGAGAAAARLVQLRQL